MSDGLEAWLVEMEGVRDCFFLDRNTKIKHINMIQGYTKTTQSNIEYGIMGPSPDFIKFLKYGEGKEGNSADSWISLRRVRSNSIPPFLFLGFPKW